MMLRGDDSGNRQKCAIFSLLLAECRAGLSECKMDETDYKLIALLRRDARTSVADLAKALGVSRGTITNRIRKLERDMVIRGYTAVIRPEAEPNVIRAWMSVQ